ncbi:unnamed protein product [Auanema sp. JU1783]|nr:unnamed protein product [Auanema sp. JU1783]
MIFILFIALLSFTDADKQCPRNSMYFDYETCNPNRRSQCPSGFTCRKSRDTDRPDLELYLCCESGDMTAGEWFAEALIAPQVFPQAPVSIIKEMKLQPLDERTEFPDVHIGDEIVVISFPSYATGTIRSVELSQAFMSTGYYHVMTIVDPGYRPFALFFSYNIPCSPSPVIQLFNNPGQPTSTAQRFITYMENTTTVPVLESYRALYVVLVFRTNSPLFVQSMGNNYNSFITGETLMGHCKDVTCLLTNSTVGRELGQPLGGSLFYLTTKRSMFPTSEQPLRDESSSRYLNLFILSLLAIRFLI